jgi:tetratricopeptide (TPR) repeat protein
MKKISLLLLLLSLVAFGQEKYTLNPEFNKAVVGDFLKHADSLFRPENAISFNLTTNYLLPYKDIPLEHDREPGYLEKQLDMIKKDSLNPFPYGNLGLYYMQRGDNVRAMEYYSKTLKKMPYFKITKDSAQYYSYKGVIKYNLGEDGGVEMEKAFSINKNDSLSVAFYPVFLISKQRFSEAEKMLLNTLDDQKNKYFGYFFLYVSKYLGRIQLFNEEGKLQQAVAAIDLKTFIDMTPYDKYFEKNDTLFEIEKELTQMYGVYIKSVVTLKDKNYKMSAADLYYINAKETFFVKMLNQKKGNPFALYVALATIKIAKRDFKGVIEYLNKGIAVFPENKSGYYFNNLEAYSSLAWVYTYLEQYDKAIEVLKTMMAQKMATSETKADALLNIAKLYYLKDNVDVATDYAIEAQQLRNNFDVNLFLSYMYFKHGLNSLGQRFAEKSQLMVSTQGELCSMVTYYVVWQIINSSYDVASELYESNKEKLANECKNCDYIIGRYLVPVK